MAMMIIWVAPSESLSSRTWRMTRLRRLTPTICAFHLGFGLDGNGAQTSLVQAAVIRDITQGIIPQRQNVTGNVPFNLMKSETLVWVIQDVEYLETVVRRERRSTCHGVSVRVARGLYYRPSTFRSRPIEWEETVHADTGSSASRPSTCTSLEAGRSSGCGMTAP